MHFCVKRSRQTWLITLTAAAALCLAACHRAPERASEGTLLTASRVAAFKDGPSPARQVAFSHDSKLFATTNTDGSVLIHRASDRRVVARLKHPDGATSVAFGPDDDWLATGGYDGAVRTWRVSDGAPMRTFSGHQGTVWTLDVSPDGTQVASAGEDKKIRLWNVADGSQLRVLAGHTLNIWQVRFSNDGKHLASGSFDKQIKLWNTASGSLLRTIAGHEQAVVGLAFSPDDRLLASGSDDSTIKIWQVADGRLVRSLDNLNHTYTLDFSRDGKWLAAGGRARGAVGTLWHQLTGAGSDGDAISLWRVSDGALMQRIKFGDDVVSVGLSADGRWLAGAGENGDIAVWRLGERTTR